MSDIIYYKNGKETFRISPPTVGTKCPETKLEVKKMTNPDIIKECRQTGRTRTTTKNLLQKAYHEQMTNKEQLKAQIQELQEQLQKLEEISPVEEAFQRVYGEYPMGEPFWVVFKKGYEEAQKDYKAEEPEELKTLYQMLDDKMYYPDRRDNICNIVKKWMSQYTCDYVMCGEYLKGYKDCLTVLEENLKND